jgi:hypothetical protein
LIWPERQSGASPSIVIVIVIVIVGYHDWAEVVWGLGDVGRGGFTHFVGLCGGGLVEESVGLEEAVHHEV